ncbi:MAG: polysaccharide pyruvyl transferase CsaB [Candidatus Eremiobacteraeota bacterium]|nr:polysaccharide pyruvyl transferase CsaB [Candidatus Eremiobacteraeota bacterium]
MRFLLSGYYGFGNVGDEALLKVIVAQLRTRHPLATLDVLSAAPEETAHEFGIAATPRWDQAAIRAAIGRADVVVSGGGGLLQNATSLRSLLYYAGIIRTALRAGKRTMVFAQSIGPLDFWGKRTVRECCKGLHAATVRDSRSRVLFAPLVPQTPVERTADPVFLYDPPPQLGAGADVLGPADPLVVVSLRKTSHYADGVPLLAAAVDRLAERHGARVAFISFGGVADAEASTAVIRKCRSKPMLVPCDGLDAIAALIARARLVIGVRLHALILAIRFGIPFLAVPYDPKVGGLIEDIAYPLAPLWTPGARGVAATPEGLVDEAWSRRDELAALLRGAAERQRGLARRNFDILGTLAAA